MGNEVQKVCGSGRLGYMLLFKRQAGMVGGIATAAGGESENKGTQKTKNT